MMTQSIFPATYSDQHGIEAISFRNDGATLETTIRGISFVGSDFDSLEPAPGRHREALGSFTLNMDRLCCCRLTLAIPVPVVLSNSIEPGVLDADLDLGAPTTNGGIEHEYLKLTLSFAESRFSSSGKSGDFEHALREIQRQLPAGTYLKTCINCLYSDYSPYGSGLFGAMLCFRNMKDAYLKVTSKAEFLAIVGLEERQVQETYLCEQFKQRVAGTGYRG